MTFSYVASPCSGFTAQPKASAETYSMSLAGAVRWTLSSRSFTSMVSVGAPWMANSTTSLWFSLSAYATVLGATLIRSSGILAPSFYAILFRNFHFGDQLGAGATPEHVIGHWCGVALEPGSHRITAPTSGR